MVQLGAGLAEAFQSVVTDLVRGLPAAGLAALFRGEETGKHSCTCAVDEERLASLCLSGRVELHFFCGGVLAAFVAGICVGTCLNRPRSFVSHHGHGRGVLE